MRQREAVRAIVKAGHTTNEDGIKAMSRESNGVWCFQVNDLDHSEGGGSGYVHKNGNVEGLY